MIYHTSTQVNVISFLKLAQNDQHYYFYIHREFWYKFSAQLILGQIHTMSKTGYCNLLLEISVFSRTMFLYKERNFDLCAGWGDHLCRELFEYFSKESKWWGINTPQTIQHGGVCSSIPVFVFLLQRNNPTQHALKHLPYPVVKLMV